ncbi:MAG: phosphonate ABC transporter, permease protein PhnE [Arachnia sp.]
MTLIRTTDSSPTTDTSAQRVADLARLHRPSWGTVLGAGIAVILIVASTHHSELTLTAVVNGTPEIVDFVSRMFPPDLSIAGRAMSLMVETLAIAITGTTFGVLFAVPLAMLATRTVVNNNVVRQSTRMVLNIVRAVPELMWALLFVSAVGLGAIAGTLALIVGTAAGMARLFADLFESSDARAWRAAEAAGARRSQLVSWVLLPQQLPTMASYTLLVLDSNVRAASLFGLVGAGGIGMELTQTLRLFEYQQVLTIVLIVLLVVVALDQGSAYLRRRLI